MIILGFVMYITKNEALDKFKTYKNEVELQLNDKVRLFRTNTGGEFYDPRYF